LDIKWYNESVKHKAGSLKKINKIDRPPAKITKREDPN
jgi:hypothetical protein